MALATALPTALPTLYEYYTGGGIQSGLNADQEYFKLNGRNISLHSGAMHYFRVPRKYWRDRIRKMRAAGLNTVETYIAWNLHEYEQGKFDFGDGGSDFQDFLNITEYFQTIKDEDMFAIVRPGPYICSEWEFGGLPSWLLREQNYTVRTSDRKFMDPVTRYFNVLIPILAALQFTKGGPILAVQVENEYGSTGNKDDNYLRELRDLHRNNGIVELLTTADGPGNLNGWLPEFLYTGNFGSYPWTNFNTIRKLQPNRPVMSMEYWNGWFDHWGEKHHTSGSEGVQNDYITVMKYPGSINFYMFHGGTSFGFMNGANGAGYNNENYTPDTTSYDYDAPLNEAGDYTQKYEDIANVTDIYETVRTRLPPRPEIVPKIIYPNSTITHFQRLNNLLKQIKSIPSEKTIPMELLPIHNNSGQSYGYIIYEKSGLNFAENSTLTVQGRVCDVLIVLINGELITKPLKSTSQFSEFGYWNKKDGTLVIPKEYKNATLQLVVENWGRNNFGGLTSSFHQLKGLWQGDILLDNNILNNWNIYPLEFRTPWTKKLTGWEEFKSDQIDSHTGPILYKTVLNVADPKADSFIDTRGWNKGIMIINGFVLGRYSELGPQAFLYLPAPFLKAGDNEILVFEHYKPLMQLAFLDKQIFI